MRVELRVVWADTDLSPRRLVNSLRNLSPTAQVTAVTDKYKGYHRPVCPQCKCELIPERNGIGVLDMADWGPCDIYDADLWKCPKCSKQVVIGFGDGPMSSHYKKEDFQHTLERYEEHSQIIKNYG